MLSFLKKNKEEVENPLVKIGALLIHAAKIDENYTEKEKQIIEKAIIELSSKNEKVFRFSLSERVSLMVYSFQIHAEKCFDFSF